LLRCVVVGQNRDGWTGGLCPTPSGDALPLPLPHSAWRFAAPPHRRATGCTHYRQIRTLDACYTTTPSAAIHHHTTLPYGFLFLRTWLHSSGLPFRLAGRPWLRVWLQASNQFMDGYLPGQLNHLYLPFLPRRTWRQPWRVLPWGPTELPRTSNCSLGVNPFQRLPHRASSPHLPHPTPTPPALPEHHSALNSNGWSSDVGYRPFPTFSCGSLAVAVHLRRVSADADATPAAHAVLPGHSARPYPPPYQRGVVLQRHYHQCAGRHVTGIRHHQPDANTSVPVSLARNEPPRPPFSPPWHGFCRAPGPAPPTAGPRTPCPCPSYACHATLTRCGICTAGTRDAAPDNGFTSHLQDVCYPVLRATL